MMAQNSLQYLNLLSHRYLGFSYRCATIALSTSATLFMVETDCMPEDVP